MVRWLLYRENVLTIILIIITKSNADLDNLNVPCKYLDSVNITNGVRNSDDDSIMFEGISYPKTLHATYDYAFISESYRQRAEPHERGCICAVDPLKPCVRMCCPRGQHFTKNGSCREDEGVFNMSVSVYDEGNTLKGNIFDLFNYVVGKPCTAGINKMEPAVRKNDTWVLLKNGNILKGDPPTETLDKNKYCLTAMLGNDTFEATLMTCFKPFKPKDRTKDYWILSGMFLSVPFLVATIVVYTIIPELRNVHGKSLVGYLCGLVVGYIALAFIKLNGSAYIDPTLCRTMGYTTYSAFLFAFFWLNVISFDLWHNFCVIFTRRRLNDLKKFVYYSIYACGSTILMTSICLAMDYNPNISTDFKPAIGILKCFLGNSRWSQFLYFYLPIMVIMISNLTFFVLTYWKIRKVQSEMETITNKEESKVHRKNLDKEKDNHGLFMRLFIVMGVTWSMEPISWIISPDGKYFYATDVMNAVQGVVIFILFVLRVKVRALLVKRWHVWRGEAQLRSSVTTTPKSYTAVSSMCDNDNMEMEMTRIAKATYNICMPVKV